MVEVIGGGEETFGEGAFLELAPDLVLMARDGWACKRDLGWGPLLQASNRGVHEAAGAIFLHGGNIRQGAELHSASVYDVVPTLLYALGLPIRSDLTGKVLHEALETEREVRVEDAKTGATYIATDSRSPTVSEKIRALTEL